MWFSTGHKNVKTESLRMACSNYIITIYDTQADPENSYVVTGYVDPGYIFPQFEEGGVVTPSELLASRSVVLSHRGGDRIDTPVIGSSLRWTFVGLDCEDGRYSDLFTGDENRFRVTVKNDNGDEIWEGFLLPDAYQEPYRNYVQNVSFQATDGLGRLKGKMPENYPSEISVVDALSMLLRLTGLNLQMRFAPGIVNHAQPDYKQIYIPTAGWADRDAYSILQGLVESLASTIYQADGYWNLEGWNIRAQTQYWTEIYSSFGRFERGELINRQIKDVTTLKGGVVSLTPPYGVLELSHSRQTNLLDEGLYRPEDRGWVAYSGAGDENVVYANSWVMEPEFPIYFDGDRVYFERISQLESGQVSLKRRPYISEGERYVLKMVFDIEVLDYVDSFSYRNPFDYQVVVGGETLYSNIDGEGVLVSTNFTDEESTFELRFEFVARARGLLDIILHPVKQFTGVGTKVIIEDVSLENINYPEVSRLTRITNEDFTTKKEVILEYAGDETGRSRAFRLSRLEQPSGSTIFEVGVIRDINMGSYWVNIVDLKSAELIRNNIGAVFTTWPTQEDIEVDRVEFNWAGSQEHAFITENRVIRPIGGDPVVYVEVFDFNPVEGDRSDWQEWSDSLYKIERNRFIESYANLLERSFSQPLERVEITLWDNLKLNDIPHINYQGEKMWVVTSCEWELDSGRSSVVATKSIFESEGLPPAVEIGGERYIVSDSVELTAEAYSPNNSIVSYFWEIVEGDGSLSSTTNQTTTVTPSDSSVRVRVTVTDENGLTASDEATVYKQADVGLSWEEISAPTLERHFRLVLSEPIPDDYVILISGSADLLNFDRNADFIRVDDGDRRLLYARLNPNIDDQNNDILNGSLQFAIPVTNESDIVVQLRLTEPEVGEGEKRLTFEVVYAYYAIGYGEVVRPAKLEIRYVR